MGFQGQYWGSPYNQQINQVISDSRQFVKGLMNKPAAAAASPAAPAAATPGLSPDVLNQLLALMANQPASNAIYNSPYNTTANATAPVFGSGYTNTLPFGAPDTLNKYAWPAPAQPYAPPPPPPSWAPAAGYTPPSAYNNGLWNGPANLMPSLEALIKRLLGDTAYSQGRQNPAINFLQTALTTSRLETDADGDGFSVTQTDLNSLKTALTNGTLSEPEVIGGFQWLFANAPANALDETGLLFAQAVDQGVLNASDLLSPDFLAALTQTQQTALLDGLAKAGLEYNNGTPNRDLAGWILGNINSANPALKTTAKALAVKMAQSWAPYWATDEGKVIKPFLTDWLGLEFDAEGKLITSPAGTPDNNFPNYWQ